MTGRAIPCLLMRGGTSRGPFFLRADLPEERDALSRVLVAVTGAGHPINIDGLGGGVAVTTKVAMLSRSPDDWAEIDFLFAQVTPDSGAVDFGPTCGNMLAGVGPAAIEMGLVPALDGETPVRIRALNTGARVEAVVQTPGGRVSYAGDARIDGVPGTAAPILLNFREVAGSATGALLPTGRAEDTIDGIPLTLIDCAMPVAVARASDLGLTGYETRTQLDEARDFLDRIEHIRVEAGRRMGMGEVGHSVVPKFAVIAPPREAGALAARYFMPWATHPSMAVSGAIAIGTCAIVPGSVAEGLARLPAGGSGRLGIEHPMGTIEVVLDATVSEEGLQVRTAGALRTARLIMRGEVMLPDGVL